MRLDKNTEIPNKIAKIREISRIACPRTMRAPVNHAFLVLFLIVEITVNVRSGPG